jgi:tRNA pseudouridine38-40 synthase
LALIVEYDGANYAGFQYQPHQPTVQGAIEKALADFTGNRIRVRAASRTDSGAHAQGQVVDFLTDAPYPVQTFYRAVNHFLPADIKIQAAYRVDLDFHSRRDASSRTYRYSILNRWSPSPLRRNTHHLVRETLDETAMTQAAQYLVGVHDFRPLAAGHPPDKSAVRQVKKWNLLREQDTLIIECEANGFLRRQIRRANALLVEVGRGKLPGTIIKDTLENEMTSTLAWPSLPASGLCLMKVTYPNFWSKVKESHETD